VHQDRQVKVTGSSPEPLLAEAAAQIMHYRIGSEGNENAYMNVWHLLGKFIEHSLAAQGDIGELIGRTLSISAMDRAIHALPKGYVRQLVYQTPVMVADYYKALLTDEAWQTLSQSTPANWVRLSDNSATKTFEKAFANAYFHFSHFGKANDSTPMRDDYAWAMWLRGTAILCQLNQELSDRMAPIYFSEPNRGVCPQAMSVNLDQDKTSQSADPHTVPVQSAETLGIFSGAKKLPYIAAVHCYALTKDEGVTVTTANRRSPRNIVTKDEEAPRYQIDFRGLAAYRDLDVPTKAIIRSMINNSKNALFNQHPRQHAVPHLRRMLPVFTADEASVAWFGGFGN
jgi:hypothetical protein